ncbi:MAG: response regulator, partial [Bacteroidota bacterium]|nr:response regulator [Bacteroidota bacterium]
AIKQALHFSQQPNTFLLIEDDSINGELIEAYLLGYAKTIIVKNGVEALRIIEEFHKENKLFDGFLVDINLPQEWDGISLRNEIIRRWHDYSRIPFIAQTAYAMSGDRKKFIDAGFDDYIAKPIIKKTLIATIDSVLKKKFQYQ